MASRQGQSPKAHRSAELPFPSMCLGQLKAKQNTARLCICLSVCRMRFQRGQPSPSEAQKEVCGSVKRNFKVNLRLIRGTDFLPNIRIACDIFCAVPHSPAPCHQLPGPVLSLAVLRAGLFTACIYTNEHPHPHAHTYTLGSVW